MLEFFKHSFFLVFQVRYIVEKYLWGIEIGNRRDDSAMDGDSIANYPPPIRIGKYFQFR